ncbi:hypothetical protein VS_II0330 [Vibrio atlanticus]|uniref:Uncharacterized protein n=1 Tax=Vibrio atlanticus (strain LGP32) TaxID=575788 RepID=B7VQU7_VIBA3|nr:hypothetical protein VS_II0330 [Vibrio atlanticus]
MNFTMNASDYDYEWVSVYWMDDVS